jgi:hypothetical protein
MGAAASSMGGPGSPGGDQGKIVLTPAQQQQLDVVSNLFQLLLSKNNIVDLASLMETEGDQCSNLIITLSAQLDKEFQRLQMKSPRGEVAEVGFLSEDQYRKIQKKETRVYMCTQIARFLLQFVILVSALTASISLMDGLPDIQPKQELYEPVDVGSYAKEEINPRILASLTDARLLKEVRATGFPSQEVYDLFGKYMIHYKGVIYTKGNSDGKSKVFGIEINYVRSETCDGVSGTSSLSSSGIPSLPGQGPSSRGYNSWLSPQEDVALQIAKAKAEETAKSAQLEEGKRRAEDQAAIERYKAQGYPFYDQGKRAKETIDQLISDIESLKRDESIRPVLDTVSQLRAAPSDSRQAKAWHTITKYNTEYQAVQNLTIALNNYESESSKYYGVTKDTMMKAYSELHSAVSKVESIKINLAEVKKQLNELVNNKLTTGGAGEYLHIKLTPVSEMSFQPPMSNGFPSQPPFQSSQSQQYQPQSSFPSGPFRPSQPNSGLNSRGATMGGATLEFIMDYAGNTYDKDYFCKMRGRVSKDQRSMTLAKRLEEIFRDTESKSVEIVNKAGKSSTSSRNTKEFTGFSFASDSIDQLTSYFKRVLSKSATEIQSPAAQRAYLLLNQMDDKFMYLKTCDDPWNDKNFSSIPAYALLGSLYKTVMDVRDDANITNATLKSIPYSKQSEDDKIWATAFNYSDLTSDPKISQYCISEPKQPGIPRNSKAASIVKTAYNELKRLYGQQLEKVIAYMKEIFVVDREFITTLSSPALAAADYQTSETVLRLNPRFLQKNANDALLEIMQRARKDLDTHYTMVEKTYQKAMEDLKNAQVGGGASASASTSTSIRKTRKHRSKRRTTYKRR